MGACICPVDGDGENLHDKGEVRQSRFGVEDKIVQGSYYDSDLYQIPTSIVSKQKKGSKFTSQAHSVSRDLKANTRNPRATDDDELEVSERAEDKAVYQQSEINVNVKDSHQITQSSNVRNSNKTVPSKQQSRLKGDKYPAEPSRVNIDFPTIPQEGAQYEQKYLKEPSQPRTMQRKKEGVFRSNFQGRMESKKEDKLYKSTYKG